MSKDHKHMNAADEKVAWGALEMLLGGETESVLEHGATLAGLLKPDTHIHSGHLYTRAVADLATAVVLYRREQRAAEEEADRDG